MKIILNETTTFMIVTRKKLTDDQTLELHNRITDFLNRNNFDSYEIECDHEFAECPMCKREEENDEQRTAR